MTRRALLILPLLVGVLAASAADPKQKSKKKPAAAPLPDLNRKVLDFAREHLGRKVDSGECNTLAVAALREAGATIPMQIPESKGDFAWGRLVATLTADDHRANEILPGDLLQFRDVRVFTSTIRGGAIRTSDRQYPHHTAVVLTVSGSDLRILHSNVDRPKTSDEKKRLVQEDPLPLNDVKRGTIWVYRPISNDEPAPGDAEGAAAESNKAR
jgi:hypothetical protein